MQVLKRIADEKRESKETVVSVTINIDGSGKYAFPINGDVYLREPSQMFYFNHGLHNLVLWGLQDLEGSLDIKDGSSHHGYEDVSIVLGRAYKEALGDKKGIHRTASGVLPFEGNRAEVAIDLSGRGYSDVETEIRDSNLNAMVNHVLMTLAREAGIDLYARTYGRDDHHQIEALFKRLGRGIYEATRLIEGYSGALSTKGKLD